MREAGTSTEHLDQALALPQGEAFVAIGAAGFGSLATPGLPALPFRTFTIAVPPDHEPVPQVSVLKEETLDIRILTCLPYLV